MCWKNTKDRENDANNGYWECLVHDVGDVHLFGTPESPDSEGFLPPNDVSNGLELQRGR